MGHSDPVLKKAGIDETSDNVLDSFIADIDNEEAREVATLYIDWIGSCIWAGLVVNKWILGEKPAGFSMKSICPDVLPSEANLGDYA